MILYTPVPQEIIFQAEMNEFDNLFEVTHHGVPLLVEKGDKNSCRIIRVLSSDPAHYLDPKYAPGNTLMLDYYVQ